MSLEDSDQNPEPDDDAAADSPDDNGDLVAYGENHDWGGNDLEAAYRKALEANDAVEWEFDNLADTDESAGNGDGEAESDHDSADANSEVDESVSTDAATNDRPNVPKAVPPRVSARQVVEAAVFVGGESLTTKKLCYMLRGDYDLDAIDRFVEELNLQYIDESRPYEIRLGEGGYRMALREEHERIRNRVFGIGPKEVRLSQDVLEVLALVAYRQPITPEEIEELGKAKPGPLLRQLLRRELIALERDTENRKRVTYSTTKRFLSLFGLGSIDELPQADELSFK